MKKITFAVFVLFACLQAKAQSGVTFSCSYNGTTEVINAYGFENDDLEQDAYNVSGLVSRILQAYNIPSKIQVIPSAQINNAVAAAKDGKPYILYSKYFVENIRNKANGEWKLIGIFAHEVGHHILFHTLGNSSSRRDLELEADKWAGAALYKLGATLEQATTCIDETNVSGSSTHPPRAERKQAVQNGYYEAQKQGGGKVEPTPPNPRPEPNPNNNWRSNYNYIKDFREGLAVVRNESGGVGYVDQNGVEVIPLIYSLAWDFSEGIGAVMSTSGLKGYVDKNGKVVVPCQYQAAGRFREGLAYVNRNGRAGFIDKVGKIIIPLEYDIPPNIDSGIEFSEGLAHMKKNGKWGFIDKTGRVVIDFQYDSALPFKDGKGWVKIGGNSFYIDKNGNCIKN